MVGCLIFKDLQVTFCPDFECQVCGTTCPMVQCVETYVPNKECVEVRCPECHAVNHEFMVGEKITSPLQHRDEKYNIDTLALANCSNQNDKTSGSQRSVIT